MITKLAARDQQAGHLNGRMIGDVATAGIIAAVAFIIAAAVSSVGLVIKLLKRERPVSSRFIKMIRVPSPAARSTALTSSILIFVSTRGKAASIANSACADRASRH
jgi:hypothetical protein